VTASESKAVTAHEIGNMIIVTEPENMAL